MTLFHKLVQFLQAIGDHRETGPRIWHGIQIVLVAWIPAEAIWLLVRWIHSGPSSTDVFRTPLEAFTTAVVLAPLLETHMMRMFFFLVKRFTTDPVRLSAITAAMWGVLHLDSESWGLHAVWVFFVLNICYLRLQPISARLAYYTVALIHAGFNAISLAVFLAGRDSFS